MNEIVKKDNEITKSSELQSLSIIEFAEAQTKNPEFQATEKEIVEIEDQYGEKLPDPNTKIGYEQAKTLDKTLVGLRTGNDKHRKGVKKDFLEAGKLIDAKAKSLEARILSIEEPNKAAKKRVDDAEIARKAEEARQAEERLAVFPNAVRKAQESNSEEIQDIIETIIGINTGTGFEKDKAKAIQAKDDALNHLNSLLSDKRALEAAEQKQAELEAEQRDSAAKQKITDAINDIKNCPMGFFEATRPSVIQAQIDHLNNMSIGKAVFGDRSEQAIGERDVAVNRLGTILKTLEDKIEAEKVAEEARQEEQQKSLDELPATKAPEVEEEVVSGAPEHLTFFSVLGKTDRDHDHLLIELHEILIRQGIGITSLYQDALKELEAKYVS